MYTCAKQTDTQRKKLMFLFFFSDNRFAFISFTKQEGAVTALQKMKGTKLGDSFLTVTPRTPKRKAKQQENLSGEKCAGL